MNHSGLSVERWSRFTLAQQILQVAVEMHRARTSFESGDDEYLRNCYERALRLVELTLECQRTESWRKELRIWKAYVQELSAAEPRNQAGHHAALRALLRMHPETSAQVELLGVPQA